MLLGVRHDKDENSIMAYVIEHGIRKAFKEVASHRARFDALPTLGCAQNFINASSDLGKEILSQAQ